MCRVVSSYAGLALELRAWPSPSVQAMSRGLLALALLREVAWDGDPLCWAALRTWVVRADVICDAQNGQRVREVVRGCEGRAKGEGGGHSWV